MSDLQNLARRKSEAEMQKAISALPAQIEAIKRELAAKGLRRSGAMLKRTRGACISAINEQAKTIISEYRWAAAQALFTSQNWIEKLIADATESMDPLLIEGEAHLRKAALFTGRPDLADRLVADLYAARQITTEDIALALRSSFAERRRGLLKVIPGFIPKLIGRFFTGGTT